MTSELLRRDLHRLPDKTFRCLGEGSNIKGKMALAHIEYAQKHHATLRESPATLWERIEDPAARVRLSGKIMESDWIDFAYIVWLDEAIHAVLGGDAKALFRELGRYSVERNMLRFVPKDPSPDRLHESFRSAVKTHDSFQSYGTPSWTPDIPVGSKILEKDARGGRMSYIYPVFDRSFCEASIGFFDRLVRAYKAMPKVTEEKCHCWGDASCTFLITW